MPGDEISISRVLQVSAYVVIVAWGIRAASDILSIVLLSLLWAYAILPFPRWLMRRFRHEKRPALALTAALLAAIHVLVYLALIGSALRMRAKLPVYEAHFSALYANVATYLSSRGVQFASLSLTTLPSSERTIQLVERLIPILTGLFSDRLLVAVLSVIFLVEMAESEDRSAGLLAQYLAHYGQDIQRYISITAQTGAIGAAMNLVLLIALRIDFPILWCFLFFVLHFIPNVGFIISVIPPAFVALLAFGWKRAVLVVVGYVVTQMIGDYVIQPLLMKRGLHISFLQVMLSLLLWGFLLGPAGTILAIPLTMAAKRFIDNLSRGGRPLPVPG